MQAVGVRYASLGCIQVLRVVIHNIRRIISRRPACIQGMVSGDCHHGVLGNLIATRLRSIPALEVISGSRRCWQLAIHTFESYTLTGRTDFTSVGVEGNGIPIGGGISRVGSVCGHGNSRILGGQLCCACPLRPCIASLYRRVNGHGSTVGIGTGAAYGINSCTGCQSQLIARVPGIVQVDNAAAVRCDGRFSHDISANLTFLISESGNAFLQIRKS